MEGINFKIKQLREQRSYTQEYMADMLNVSSSTYSRIEMGQQDIQIGRLLQIANILEVDIRDLFASDGNEEETKDEIPEPSKAKSASKPEVTLQIKLDQEKADQVLRFVFGKKGLETLYK